MPLNYVHEKIDDIPEEFRALYTEQEGKFILTGIGGIKTQADIDRLSSSLTKERDDHKETREKLRPWSDLGLELPDITGKLDRFAELEIAASGNREEMDTRLEELTEARIGSRLAPVQRENETFKRDLASMTEELTVLRREKVQRTIRDSVNAEIEKSGVAADALVDARLLADTVFALTEDGAILTKENPYGVSAGLTPELWILEMKDKRSLWWETSRGGDSTGSRRIGGNSAPNPWKKDSWNMTNQGKYIIEHGEEKANAAAKLAGTTVGGLKPS